MKNFIISNLTIIFLYSGYFLFPDNLLRMTIITGAFCSLLYGDKGIGVLGYVLQSLRNFIIKKLI